MHSSYTKTQHLYIQKLPMIAYFILNITLLLKEKKNISVHHH